MRIPIGVSNRHIHLGKDDADKLFGPGYEFKVLKELSQPGQYACEEVVTLVGPKNKLEKVRILGPFRKDTQVEISIADSFVLGVEPMIKISGDIEGTPGLTVVGPAGSVVLQRGVIVAQRHIHMTTADAAQFGLKDEQIVAVRVLGPRGLVFENVSVRVRDDFALDMHVDIEEANAAGLKSGAWGELVK